VAFHIISHFYSTLILDWLSMVVYEILDTATVSTVNVHSRWRHAVSNSWRNCS